MLMRASNGPSIMAKTSLVLVNKNKVYINKRISVIYQVPTVGMEGSPTELLKRKLRKFDV